MGRNKDAKLSLLVQTSQARHPTTALDNYAPLASIASRPVARHAGRGKLLVRAAQLITYVSPERAVLS